MYLDSQGVENPRDGGGLIGAAASAGLPGPISSLYYGAMLPGTRHKAGLQSGGMLGYSTFFTGYREGMGAGRRMSVGRLAAKGVEMAGHVIGGQQWAQSERIGGIAARMQVFGKYGVGAFAQAAAPMISAADITSISKMTDIPMGSRPPTPLMPKPNGAAANNSVVKKLMGFLGGTGYTDQGDEAFGAIKNIVQNGRNISVLEASAGSVGATALKGTMGKLLGASVKAGGYLQLAVMAANVAGRQLGAAYATAARVGDAVKRSSDPRMSAAYMSGAANSERQRAMFELNSSVLNPRTQMMGNEASFIS